MSLRFDAYAAGLVDGEGCITAKATKSGTGMGIRVLIGMATKAQEVLARMQGTYGGTLITQSPTNPTHSQITTWTVTGADAAAFLRRIEPHLMLKMEQARIALKINEIRTSQERIGTRDHFRWTEENLNRCQVLYRRLNELNARGRESSPPSAGREIARLVAGQWVTDQTDMFSDLGWEPFTATWPRSGCMSGGRAFELPTLVPRITGSDCSSSPHLPTPRATRGGSATETVNMLPTPIAADGDRERNNPSQARRKSPPLSAVGHLLPTPKTNMGTGVRREDSRITDLQTVIARIGGSTNSPFAGGSS